MESVFITGASGLLGSHVIKKLLIDDTYKPIVLVRTEEKSKIWEKYGIQTVIGNLENCSFTVPNNVLSIIHIAAIAGDWVDKKKAFLVNVKATRYLLDQTVSTKCPTFLHISTIGVYGHSKYEGVSEDRLFKKSSYYENTKIEAEKLIFDYQKINPEIRFIVLRASSMYGEGDRHILPRFINYLKKGKFIFIGGGNNLFPIMHASDAAKAVILSLSRVQGNFSVYNLCDDSKITFREFIEILTEYLGLENNIKSAPYRIAYSVGFLLEIIGKIRKKEPFIFRKRVKYLGVSRNVSIQKIRKELNFEPEIHPREGIPSTLINLDEETRFRANNKLVDEINVIPYHLYKIINKNRH